MVSIRYPTADFRLADLEGSFNDAFDRSRGFRLEREGNEALGKYSDWLTQSQGGGGQPMSLASLGAPVGQVTRAPLDTVADPASARVAQAHATAGGQPSVGDMTAYIAKAAQARGIDPGVAIRVARSEGLAPGVWQSQLGKNGRREPSYGPFQLLVGGGETGYPTGLGNAFVEQTGLSPTDPANWQKTVDFALDNASKSGWGAWYGAGKAGIGDWQGINRGAAPTGGQQALEGLAVGESMQMPPAQVADASGGMPMGQPSSLLPPSDVMRALFANPNTRELAAGLAQSAMKMRQDASDPLARLEYQKALLGVQKLQQELAGGDGDTEYGLNPQTGVDENGNPVLIQLGKNGTSVRTPLPEGVTLQKEPIKLDAGTKYILLDPITRQPVGEIAKDLAGAEKAKVEGEAAGKASVAAAGDAQAAQNALDLIESIRNDPYLDRGTGFSSLGNTVRGTGGYDFQNKVEQAKSGAFLSAIETMRGLGALSNTEGQTATAAVNRMDTATSKEAFLAALDDYEKVVRQGLARAESRLGQAPDGAPAPSGEGWSDAGNGVRIRRKQ